MKTTYKSIITILLLSLFAFLGPVSLTEAQDGIEAGGYNYYTYTNIDFPGAIRTSAGSINDAGQILGLYLDENWDSHHFLFSNGSYTSIDFPGAFGTGTWVSGINDAGQIIGWYHDQKGWEHGFLFSNGSYTSIDFPLLGFVGAPPTRPNDINNAGQIVGVYYDNNLISHGFLFSDGIYTSIDFPDATSTYVSNINNAGQIIGWYHDNNWILHGFLFSNGSYTSIDFPGAISTMASEINNAGQILGSYNDVVGGEYWDWRDFLFSGGSYISIGFPGAFYTKPSTINDAGQIIGWYHDNNWISHGFLFSGGYTSIDFPGAFETYVHNINDDGVIVGSYTYENSWISHGFLFSGGSYISIGFPGAFYTKPSTINDDGVIVGSYRDLNGRHGFVATPFGENQPPVALFDYSPESPLVGQEVRFESSSYDPDGEIVKYHWDFGDGNTREEIAPAGKVAIHTYTEPGTYPVTLTVTDDGGSTDAAEKNITIEGWITLKAWISGHFTIDLEAGGKPVAVPLHVEVLDYAGQPIEGASVLVYDTLYGHTDANGYLSIEYPIHVPDDLPVEYTEDYTVIIDAVWENLSANERFTFYYTVERVKHKSASIWEPETVYYYNWMLILQHLGISLPISLEERIGSAYLFALHWFDGPPFTLVQLYDEFAVSIHTLTAAGLDPAWLVTEKVYRGGEAIKEGDAWIYSENVYNKLNEKELLSRRVLWFELHSPAVLYITAPDGSHAGYDPSTGELVADFPIVISEPGEEPFQLFIPQPLEGEYKLDVMDIDTGDYTLSVQALDSEGVAGQESNFTKFINKNEIHSYHITVPEEGDIVVKEATVIPATIDCDPDTLNLKSQGQWITCYIELPASYDVWQIDGSTILLNGVIPAYLGEEGWAKLESNESNIMDHDGDGILERMVKFDRARVQAILTSGEAVLTLIGKIDSADFEGSDAIRVIDKGKGKK